VDWWKLTLYGLLYTFAAAFLFLVLILLRQRWGFYLLISRDYGIELSLAAVGGLALAWLVANAIKADR
jgi:hypothetical protein